MSTLRAREDLIDSLRSTMKMTQKTVEFQRNLVTQLKEENAGLIKKVDIFSKLISGQEVPIEYKRYDPDRWTAAQATVLQGAINLTRRKGSFWKDQELFDFLKKRNPAFEYSYKTVARRCQELVVKGDLERVAPATYIYYKGERNEPMEV